MSLPDVIERSRENLDLSPEGLVDDALPGIGRTLNFQMEPQSQNLWCWAAVAVSVARFYNSATIISQCSVANAVLHTNLCCSNGLACNQIARLDLALGSNLAPPVRPSAASFVEVMQMINNNRPIGCGIRWLDGKAHFVSIYGFSTDLSGTAWLAIADPVYGNSDLPYQSFLQNYRGAGRWVASYATKP